MSLESYFTRKLDARHLSKKNPRKRRWQGAAPPRAKLRASVTDIHSVGARRFASANSLPGRQWVDGTAAETSLRLYEQERKKETRSGLKGKRREKRNRPVPLTSRREWSTLLPLLSVTRHTSARRYIHITYAYTHVPVVRRTPDIQARHIHDREREAREDRGYAVVRVIGTPFRGLHNSITPMSVACVALHCGRGAR